MQGIDLSVVTLEKTEGVIFLKRPMGVNKSIQGEKQV